MMYRHFATAAIALGLSSGLAAVTASAADLGQPGPAPIYTKAPAAVPFSWSGFYVGANAGGLWGTSDVDMVANPAFFTGGTAALIDAAGSPTLKDSGFLGGVQAGANWQMSSFVVGLETDIQYAHFGASAAVTNGPIIPQLPHGFSVSESVKSDWLFTFRPRVGVAVDRALFYATGGLAVANPDFSQSSFFPDCPCGVTSSASGTKAGWTAGGGLEYAFAPSWSAKAEYLHVDLGTESFADSLGASGFPTASFTHSEKLTEDIVRAGVNYRFRGW